MILVPLRPCPTSQKLGASISNWGGQKSHCWRSITNNNPWCIKFPSPLKTSLLTHYLECIWWVRFFTHYRIFLCPNNVIVIKLLFFGSLFIIWNFIWFMKIKGNIVTMTKGGRPKRILGQVVCGLLKSFIKIKLKCAFGVGHALMANMILHLL